MRNVEIQNNIKSRTKEFAKQVIKLCRELPENYEGRLIRGQLLRAGTSVASNYTAAWRARSTAEFISKLGIVEEEADETLFWLELLKEMKIISGNNIETLMTENNEIISIIVSSIKTASKRK